MLYTRSDGSISMHAQNYGVEAENGLVLLQEAIKAIDQYYEYLDVKQHRKLCAMAGRLIAMVEDE